MTLERRFTAQPVTAEIRDDGEGKRIAGYAAVYSDGTERTEFELAPGIKERIAAGAFSRALREKQDVRALVNHDPNLVLGRRAARTLTLTSDDEGLRYVIDPPDTQIGRDTVTSIERGDVTGSSFAFVVTREKWIEDEERGVDVREIQSVDLLDVGPVTFPAYTATSAGVRSAGGQDEWRAGYDAWQAKKRQDSKGAVQRRAKIVGALSQL